MRKLVFKILTFCLFLVFSNPAYAQDSLPSLNPDNIRVGYGNKGFELATADNNFLLQIQSRLQFRMFTPFSEDPYSFDDLDVPTTHTLTINRARLKIGGNAFKPWLKYYWEYEVYAGNLLDFRIMVERWSWLKFKVGQWKTEFNRERMISSGNQQMVDRSIINRPFNVDRQQGIAVYGHIEGNGAANFNYWLTALTGTGREARFNDDEHLMYTARLQWNFLGRPLEMTGSDPGYREKPAAIIAIAGVTNKSLFTRFSSDGGGALSDFPIMGDVFYRMNQGVIETAFMYRGFSWQSELHQKEIHNPLNDEVTTLRGGYLQAGFFPHQIFPVIPAPLELAGRYALFIPNVDEEGNNVEEFSVVTNWFFAEHRNKLSMEYSLFNVQNEFSEIRSGGRFRIQWEISF